jgi:hypothetical protein
MDAEIGEAARVMGVILAATIVWNYELSILGEAYLKSL